MKEFVMCKKKWKLKSPLNVNRPLEFIEAPQVHVPNFGSVGYGASINSNGMLTLWVDF